MDTFSSHRTKEKRSLRNRIVFIWDFLIHSTFPKRKGKKLSHIKAPDLLKILNTLDPDGDYNEEQALNIIKAVMGAEGELLDRGGFVAFMKEHIPDADSFFELDCLSAFQEAGEGDIEGAGAADAGGETKTEAAEDGDDQNQDGDGTGDDDDDDDDDDDNEDDHEN